MTQCVVTVEVMTAEWDLVSVFEKRLQHAIAKGKIEAAACDSRAIATLDDVCEWDMAITVWNNREDEDRYLIVYFPAGIACQAIAQHFQIDAWVLQRATTLAEVRRLCSEQESRYAKAMQALGFHKNSESFSD